MVSPIQTKECFTKDGWSSSEGTSDSRAFFIVHESSSIMSYSTVTGRAGRAGRAKVVVKGAFR